MFSFSYWTSIYYENKMLIHQAVWIRWATVCVLFKKTFSNFSLLPNFINDLGCRIVGRCRDKKDFESGVRIRISPIMAALADG